MSSPQNSQTSSASFYQKYFAAHLQAAGAAPLSVEAVLHSVGVGTDLEQMARDVLAGSPLKDNTLREEDRFHFFNGWLRFTTGDTDLFRMRWAALARSKDPKLADRDGYALALWRQVTQHEAWHPFIAHVEAHWCPRDYYERHFFGWFLDRLNIRAARQVFRSRALAPAFSWVLLLTTLLLIVAGPAPHLALPRWSILGLIGLVFVAGAVGLRLPLYAYLNSLVPRLAATVGIGYLFMINAPQVVKVMHEFPSETLWTVTVVLLLTSLAFVTMHISRRVQPSLKCGALLSRSLELWALAVTYAAIGLQIAAPVLFSATLWSAQTPVQAEPEHLALCAAIALNLGVILQLAWEEKPVTEPL